MPLIVTKQEAEARGARPVMGRVTPARQQPLPSFDPIDRATAEIAAAQNAKNKRIEELQKAWEKNSEQVIRLEAQQEAYQKVIASFAEAQRKSSAEIAALAVAFQESENETNKTNDASMKCMDRIAVIVNEKHAALMKLIASQDAQIQILTQISVKQAERTAMVEEIAGLQHQNDVKLEDVISTLSRTGDWIATVKTRDSKDRILTVQLSEMK
jgi:chromosome segregation ATPase